MHDFQHIRKLPILIFVSIAILSCSSKKPSSEAKSSGSVVHPEQARIDSLVQDRAEEHKKIWLREGFKLELVSTEIKKPRFMQQDDQNRIFVSLPVQNLIMCLWDEDKDGYYEKSARFVESHLRVYAMQWHDGWLWYAETGAVFKARDTNGDGIADEKVTIIKKGNLPQGSGHWWRSLLIHNQRLYTSIGCSGDITDETDSERLKIWSFNLGGGDKQYYCGGLRNTEKLVNRPGTDEIWGMDHGSDWFGRNL